jgi:hypothetical protein
LKKIIASTLLLVAGIALYFVAQHESPERAPLQDTTTGRHEQADDALLRRVFESRSSGVQVNGAGTVEKVLKDDLEGSRHQRFIVRLASGQTLLIAHNIDLAPRVASIAVGDAVSFFGVYEWNRNGGTVHWTHHDPKGKHPGGWIRHQGKTYE